MRRIGKEAGVPPSSPPGSSHLQLCRGGMTALLGRPNNYALWRMAIEHHRRVKEEELGGARSCLWL